MFELLKEGKQRGQSSFVSHLRREALCKHKIIKTGRTTVYLLSQELSSRVCGGSTLAMKLLAVLLLCAQAFSTKADLNPIQDASCNDPKIFEAVDLALRKYNAGRKEGYQFALNRITEAGISSAGVGDEQYHVAYETRESTCAAQDGHLWQDCQFRPIVDAATGSCKAHVYTKKAENSSSVISQDCNITSAEGPVLSVHYVCLGCPHPIPHNSEELRSIVEHGVRKFNAEGNQENLFKFGQVKKASRQVVAGWNYDIEYTIIETNCSKNSFSDVNAECLPFQLLGACHAAVYVIANESIADFNQKCTISASSARLCLGCPEPIAANSTDLVEPLSHAMNKFNSENNHQFLYRVAHVVHATKQVVAGMKYDVTFHIRPTNCSKEENQHLHDGCHFPEKLNDGEENQCKASIVVVPWLKEVGVKSLHCAPTPHMAARYAGIHGLTPFRRVGIVRRDVGHPPGHGKGQSQGHAHGHGPKPGHSCEHPKGKEHKHDKKKCRPGDHQESSEESHEKFPQKPMSTVAPQIPDVPKSTPSIAVEKPAVLMTTYHPEETSAAGTVLPGDAVVLPLLPEQPIDNGLFPNLPGDLLPDLPEPPVPMCPGEPWRPKPLNPTSPPPTPETFKDSDLLLDF